MTDLLGESATSAILYHIGGNEALKDPDIFGRRLESILGEGADVILDHIIKNLKKANG